MGSSSENLLKQSFGGVYSNELFAEGGRLYSERPEPFSYISVEVRFFLCIYIYLVRMLYVGLLKGGKQKKKATEGNDE